MILYKVFHLEIENKVELLGTKFYIYKFYNYKTLKFLKLKALVKPGFLFCK